MNSFSSFLSWGEKVLQKAAPLAGSLTRWLRHIVTLLTDSRCEWVFKNVYHGTLFKFYPLHLFLAYLPSISMASLCQIFT